jgi:hypothetical protein
MKSIKLFNMVFFCSLVFLSLGMYGQDRLINPTSTFLELGNDVPTYKCDTFDIGQMVEMSENDLLNGVSPLRFAKKFAVSQWSQVFPINKSFSCCKC